MGCFQSYFGWSHIEADEAADTRRQGKTDAAEDLNPLKGAKNLEWTVCGSSLVLRCPDIRLDFGPSTTGKTLIVASSCGHRQLGKSGVFLNFLAYRRPDQNNVNYSKLRQKLRWPSQNVTYSTFEDSFCVDFKIDLLAHLDAEQSTSRNVIANTKGNRELGRSKTFVQILVYTKGDPVDLDKFVNGGVPSASPIKPPSSKRKRRPNEDEHAHGGKKPPWSDSSPNHENPLSIDSVSDGVSPMQLCFDPIPDSENPTDEVSELVADIGDLTVAFFRPGEAFGSSFEVLCDALRAAKRTLDVAVYVLSEDRLADLLMDRHHAGVSVRIITDHEMMNGKTCDIKRLEQEGIKIRVATSRFRMHHKLAVCDGHVCVSGSFNWTGGAARNNHENLIVSRCIQTAQRCQAEFNRLWALLAPGSSRHSISGGGAPDGTFDGSIMVLFFPDRDDANLHKLLNELSRVEKTLDVAVFTIAMRELVDLMIAAHGRGVRVRVITDDGQAKVHGGKHINQLQCAGIEVRTDHSPSHMHHKFAILDGCTVVNGSFNWTRQAEDGNQEDLLIFKDEADLAARFEMEFEHMWNQFVSVTWRDIQATAA